MSSVEQNLRSKTSSDFSLFTFRFASRKWYLCLFVTMRPAGTRVFANYIGTVLPWYPMGVEQILSKISSLFTFPFRFAARKCQPMSVEQNQLEYVCLLFCSKEVAMSVE
jgi:hypothetical protein